MTTTSGAVPNNAGWDLSFWFAVLSPALGMLIGFLVLLLIYS
jgi:hypothetical protein